VTSSGTPTANPGEIDCGPSCFTSVDTGTSVTLTASANPGYHLQGWSGSCSGSSSTCAVSVNGLATVTATFYPDTPTLYVSDASTYEGRTGTTHKMKFGVFLSSPSVGTTTVSYSTVDGTAASGSDFSARTATLSIGANKSSGTAAVTVIGDNAAEGDESLGLSVGAVSGGYVIGTSQATGSISDDDTASAPVLSVGDTSIVEGNSATANAIFAVTLSAPSATTTPVTYETADGSATTAGSDYTARTGTVSIPAGAVKARIAIPVQGDTTVESAETFSVKVTGTGSSGIEIDRDHATGRILDDDTGPVSGASVGDVSVMEGDTGQKVVTLPVTLAAPQSTDTVVRYHTLDGTATADGDYVKRVAKITIRAGRVSGAISILVNGDTTTENTETSTVVLDSAGAVTLGRPNGTIMILEDD